MSDEYEAQALDIIDRIAAMSDDELRRAYLECNGGCGDPLADALAQACEDREIDI